MKQDGMFNLLLSTILSMPNASMTFITGSTNFRLSTLKYHESSECHKWAEREEEHEGAVSGGETFPPRKVLQQVPSSSLITQGFKQMSFN